MKQLYDETQEPFIKILIKEIYIIDYQLLYDELYDLINPNYAFV